MIEVDSMDAAIERGHKISDSFTTELLEIISVFVFPWWGGTVLNKTTTILQTHFYLFSTHFRQAKKK